MPKKIYLFLPILLIIVAGCLVYANSISGKFIWDDELILLAKNNINIKELFQPWRFFSKDIRDIGMGAAARQYYFYRPAQVFSYIVDSYIWNWNPVGYHITNILIHILAGLSIYWLINILFRDNLISLFTSLLFIVNPIHTESVAYITGRADPLAALFILLSFIFYLKYLRSGNVLTFSAMCLAYVLAVLSRENSLILPLIFLLYHYAFKEKVKIIPFSCVSAIAIVYAVARITTLKSILPHLSAASTVLQRLPGFFVAMTNYVKLLFLPLDLHMEYGSRLFSFADPRAILGVFIVSVLLIFAFVKRKTKNLTFFSICFFFITLMPQSNLYPMTAYMAEHWLYLPSIGFFLIVGSGISYLYKKRSFNIIALAILAGLVASYSYLTIKQNLYWTDPITFYERTLRYVNDSPRIYSNLANIYYGRRMYKEAAPLYEKAITLDSSFAEAYNNLGAALYYLGRGEEAVNMINKAILYAPDFADAYKNLGDIYINSKRYEEAVGMYKNAIALNPNFIDAEYNLGYAYLRLGRYDEAIEFFNRVLAVSPDNAIARINIAVAYYSVGKYELAIKHCDAAVDLGYKVYPQFLELLEKYRK